MPTEELEQTNTLSADTTPVSIDPPVIAEVPAAPAVETPVVASEPPANVQADKQIGRAHV